MPRPAADLDTDDFEIHVDQSCLNSPMDKQTAATVSEVVEPRGQDNAVHDTKENSKTAESGKAESARVDDKADRSAEAREHGDVEDTPQGPPAGDVKELNVEEHHAQPEEQAHNRRESGMSEVPDHVDPAEGLEGDAGGDSSSQQEGDDDVFSDHSPRSSMGSVDMASGGEKAEGDDDKSRYGRPARISGISDFSNLDSNLDEDDVFVPETRGTPRHAFRTTSAVRAMQMSSPTASVFSTPRSSGGGSKRPTAIPPHSAPRLSSPSASTQYSPKGRSTPTRFKVKKEPAPLVLLHATLLPLRWTWGDVLDEGFGMPAEDGSDEGCFKASEDLKRLRDNWKELQDRMGDTVLERGILLPHPQSDYEVLEERLLEALELPMRRRARILECGHYLGPSNLAYVESSEDDTTTDESEDDYAATPSRQARRKTGASSREARHWCGTCRSDIKYEALGPGKVFRVKIYASNGLMRAGAWEACWKEMERVDAEVEPVLEPSLQTELERLESWQAAEHQRREEELDRQAAEEFNRHAEEDIDPRTDEELMQEAEAHLAAAEAEAAAHEAQFEHAADEQPERPHDDVEHEFGEDEKHEDSFADQTEIIHPSSPRPSSPSVHRESLGTQDVPSSPAREPDDGAEEAAAAGMRRRRDEERRREIYGQSPSGTSRRDSVDFGPQSSPAASPAPSNNREGRHSSHRDSMLSGSHAGGRRDSLHSITRDSQQQMNPDESMGMGEDSFMAPQSPVSPSVRAFDLRSQSSRSQSRRSMRVALHEQQAPRPDHPLRQETHPSDQQQPSYRQDPSHPHQQPTTGYSPDQQPPQQRRRGDESLPELLLEAANVLMRDRKNVAIAALGLLVLIFALRSPSTPVSYGVAEREAEIMRTLYMQQQLQLQQQQQQQYLQQQQQHQQQQQQHKQPELAATALPAEVVEALGSSSAPVVEVAQTVAKPASEAGIVSGEDDSSPKPVQEESRHSEGSESGSADAAAAAAATAAPPPEKEVVKVYETVTETVKVTATESVAEQTPASATAAVEVEGDTVVVDTAASVQDSTEVEADVAAPEVDADAAAPGVDSAHQFEAELPEAARALDEMDSEHIEALREMQVEEKEEEEHKELQEEGLKPELDVDEAKGQQQTLEPELGVDSQEELQADGHDEL
ncbi:hypothetical protein MAPG_04633 [Magnaporthiopsis poae ATCC 64411]|uniref:Pathway-specific nitrogen regulator n=1 Tax=Magnaporthiopsis poae (strain ATCC 64411 / 73-15) TaxID=644358 RepID=A0A0C4DX94_MAGP6|nr:hypothetical protein MAPG_04633 [Magnaporthiopsis poae ATCC 64411]